MLVGGLIRHGTAERSGFPNPAWPACGFPRGISGLIGTGLEGHPAFQPSIFIPENRSGPQIPLGGQKELESPTAPLNTFA